ncbi:MAG: methyltransferase domain-containing protein [Candidatus Micrarchaeaceae archaeon]
MFLPEHYRKLKRGPQVMLPKDIGMVIAYAGIGKNSVCVDAGTGSGWLAVSLAKICKQVTSYEVREEFIRIAETNAKKEGVENLNIVNRDIRRGIREKNVDLVSLDMPGSDKVVGKAYKALRDGGFIFGYLPHMEQVKAFVKELNKHSFSDIVVLEDIVRDMLVRKEGMRPSTKGVWHTGYLVFAQKKAKPGLEVKI